MCLDISMLLLILQENRNNVKPQNNNEMNVSANGRDVRMLSGCCVSSLPISLFICVRFSVESFSLLFVFSFRSSSGSGDGAGTHFHHGGSRESHRLHSAIRL